MAEAKAKIEARAKARFEREQADLPGQVCHTGREAEEDRQEAGWRPKPPAAGPKAEDQINLTDEELRIMQVAGGGFEQAYNAQATVDMGSLLVVVPG